MFMYLLNLLTPKLIHPNKGIGIFLFKGFPFVYIVDIICPCIRNFEFGFRKFIPKTSQTNMQSIPIMKTVLICSLDFLLLVNKGF